MMVQRAMDLAQCLSENCDSVHSTLRVFANSASYGDYKVWKDFGDIHNDQCVNAIINCTHAFGLFQTLTKTYKDDIKKITLISSRYTPRNYRYVNIEEIRYPKSSFTAVQGNSTEVDVTMTYWTATNFANFSISKNEMDRAVREYGRQLMNRESLEMLSQKYENYFKGIRDEELDRPEVIQSRVLYVTLVAAKLINSASWFLLCVMHFFTLPENNTVIHKHLNSSYLNEASVEAFIFMNVVREFGEENMRNVFASDMEIYNRVIQQELNRRRQQQRNVRPREEEQPQDQRAVRPRTEPERELRLEDLLRVAGDSPLGGTFRKKSV